MYHYFYLVREMPKDIYGMDVDYIKLVKIDDDIILYFYDFIRWIPTNYEYYRDDLKEIKEINGLNYHGNTIIKKNSATDFLRVIKSLLDILYIAPESFYLTSHEVIDHDDKYEFVKINFSKPDILSKFNDLAHILSACIESNDEVFVYHSGV